MEATGSLPRLPVEVVAAALAHASLSTIGCAGRVCRDWLTASRSEALGLVVLRRRWQFETVRLQSDAATGNRARDDGFLPSGINATFAGWWQLLRALARLDDYFVDLRRLGGGCESIHHLRLGCIVGVEFAAALDRLDREVQEFVLGIMAGFMPTVDGLFTYQAPGATPIHYRHLSEVGYIAPSDVRRGPGEQVTPNNGLAQLGHGAVLVGRRGGRWEWSTDRATWSSTATVDIPEKSLFGGNQWTLVPQNQQLVRFLDEHPVVPLFHGQVLLANTAGGTGEGRFPRSVDEAFWASSHGGVYSHNRLQLETFKQRIVTHAPTMPCVTSRSLTVHQLLQPPIVVCLDQPANTVVPCLPMELNQALQLSIPYRVARQLDGDVNEDIDPIIDRVSVSIESWRTWDVLRLAYRTVRLSLQQARDSYDDFRIASLSLPQDADGGFVLSVGPL